MKRISLKYVLPLITIIAMGLWVVAVEVPHSFDAGETISSSSVNENFQVLESAVSALEQRLTLDGAVVARSSDRNNPDLILGGNDLSDVGDNGVISSDPELSASDLEFKSNDNIILDLNANADADAATLTVRNGAGDNALTLSEAGDLSVSGTVSGAGGAGLPLAYGSVAADGTLRSGTDTIASVELQGSSYRITLEGESYNQSAYVTTVTPAGLFDGLAAPTVRTAASGSSLVILFYKDGGLVTGDFHFVVFKF